jgi:7-cyano-7-deazaguanine synthase
MRAVVLLSGGLDSATALAIARERGFECFTLTVDYGQRHRAELVAARRIAADGGSSFHHELDVPIGAFGGSALTDEHIAVPEQGGDGIPVTYVPARNTVLLSLALSWAEVLGAQAIFIGVNAIDYSGYPDCRPEFVEAFGRLAAVATKQAVEGSPVRIEAPLLELSKAQIIRLGTELGVDFALSVSCYQADDAGRACGRCEACEFRRRGFAEAGVADPTRYRSEA